MSQGEALPFAVSEADGYWLAGLTDGEGHFAARAFEREGIRRVDLMFTIGLRSDDRLILDELQQLLSVGHVHTDQPNGRTNPISRWDVSRLDELLTVIVPLFRRFPLRSKKARDFDLWRVIVLLLSDQRERRWQRIARNSAGQIVGTPPTWSADEWDHVVRMCAELREERQFMDPAARADAWWGKVAGLDIAPLVGAT